QDCRGAGLHPDSTTGTILSIRQSNRQVINGEDQVVIDRLRRREVELEDYVLVFIAWVVKRIGAIKSYLVGAVPQQTFLPMFEIQIDVDVTTIEWQLRRCRLLSDGFDYLA